jgi:predicted nucleotidyltransferase
MMKPSDALEKYRDQILRLIAAHSLRNPRVFGSVSRGEDSESSDLDILVDIDERTSYFDIIGAELDIEDLTGLNVDLFSVEELKPRVKERALAEALPL